MSSESECLRRKRQHDAGHRGLPSVFEGQRFRAAVREEPGVCLAVMTDRDGAVAQMDNVHHVRVTGVLAGCVFVVAPMCRRRRSLRHFEYGTW